MYRINHRTFDSITMRADAIAPNGTTVKIKLTYAFGPISAYDDSNGCWLSAGEWEWYNL
jgi:hypothetical protein